YGMPVLDVADCKNIFIFNYDLKPGYAGVDNPIYTRENGVHLYLGNAQETLQKFIADMDKPVETTTEVKAEKTEAKPVEVKTETNYAASLNGAKEVIIVPGYGMAIAQAQHLVKQLADKLAAGGTKVKYAIHPVAGRMPGHMNVLLCEADVDYEDLYEMDDINPEFKTADATIVIGANDVLNPAANTAEGTPIYGMPVLDVADCKNIFIFNYDLKPGYAGVDNPLYTRDSGVYLYLGNAQETLQKFISDIDA
ncbi:MAG: NAD(P)(+) transhydrogenase (Re/Si-specific) subunit beta, partial [Eubacteriales bacterium]|nr:NAD(P)(+) transhydrogenase (Re/Si-specific) subunit beta [Eubacteriales bacterium]